MAIGTAGYTAMLCVLALERHGVAPGDGEVLVTGATGGVGSVADRLARARSATAVVASTGKADEADYLKQLGAAEVIDRAELAAPGKPLQKERWAAVVDAVGSHTLANALAQTRYGGVVAACGLAQGIDLPATVHAVHPARRDARRHRQRDGADRAAPRAPGSGWRATSTPGALDADDRGGALERAIEKAEALMAGEVRGRIVVADRRLRATRRRQRTSCSSCLNFGCSLVPSHSKMTISVVTTSAPSVRARSVAAWRSCGWREPTASATHFTGCPASSRPATVCITQTCASQPATTKRVAAVRQAAQEALLGGRREVELRERRVAEAGDLGDERAEAVGIFLGADDVDAELARGRRELDAAPHDGLAVVDRGHQARLGVDDQQRALVRAAQSKRHRGLLVRRRDSGSCAAAVGAMAHRTAPSRTPDADVTPPTTANRCAAMRRASSSTARAVECVADEPALRPGVNALGVTYDFALREELRADDARPCRRRAARRVNRMLHVDQSSGDLLNKLEAVRLLCQETGCAQRYLAHDAFNAIAPGRRARIDADKGTRHRARFAAYLHDVQDQRPERSASR